MLTLRPQSVAALPDVMAVCRSISETREEVFALDLSDIRFWNPFAALAIIGYCRQAISIRGRKIDLICNNPYTRGYLEHIRFFDHLNDPENKQNRQSRVGDSYVAITTINRAAYFARSAGHGEQVLMTIHYDSGELARLLLKNSGAGEQLLLAHAIREIIRNAVEHSQSENILYFAQSWPSKRRVQVAIMDNGLGIKRTISKNPKLLINSDYDALKMSILPGISGTPNKKHEGNLSDSTRNSGFGLFIVSQICRKSEGFLIQSGQSALSLKRDETRSELVVPNFFGTLLRLDAHFDALSGGRETLNDIVKHGERHARELNGLGALSPSRASAMLDLSNIGDSLRRTRLTFSQDE
jgi:hypothetical protein